MNQRSPLLRYRIKSDEDFAQQNFETMYDYISGMWFENGIPVIKNLLEIPNDFSHGNTISIITTGRDLLKSSYPHLGQTLVTETRESIDRSERATGPITPTTITKTRESVDQSEKST